MSHAEMLLKEFLSHRDENLDDNLILRRHDTSQLAAAVKKTFRHIAPSPDDDFARSTARGFNSMFNLHK